jgi:hypothetical protein
MRLEQVMQTQEQWSKQSEFAEYYAAMADSELFSLYRDRGSLLAEAQAALESEMARRGLQAHGNLEELKQEFANPEQDTELPYRWGKFVGGASVLAAILACIEGFIQHSLTAVLASAFFAITGFGVYEKRKWAVTVLEVTTVVPIFVILCSLGESWTSKEVTGAIVSALLNIPQVYYFWRRRNELR